MVKSLLVFGLSALLAACSSSDNSSSSGAGGAGGAAPTPPTLTDPSADTQALWTKISGYTSWSKFPENTTLKQSAQHNNMFVLAYYNEVVGASVTSQALPLADGAIIVKENYAKATDATPMALTVMSKMGTDWYWVEGTPDGQVIGGPNGPLEGKNVAMCQGCHGAATDNDSVMTHKF